MISLVVWRPRPDLKEFPTQGVRRSSFFEGKVGLLPLPPALFDDSNLGLAPLDHPNLDGASALLKKVWPEAYIQLPEFVAVVHPVTHAGLKGVELGSSSGCQDTSPPAVYISVEHLVPTAEALVHEMAHHKLHSAGVGLESAPDWLRNPHHETYFSEAVGLCRPLPAILHAGYTFLHMSELDVRIIEGTDNLLGADAQRLLPGNLRVATQTLAQLRTKGRPTDRGKEMIEGMSAWLDFLIKQSSIPIV